MEVRAVLEALYRNALDLGDREAARAILDCDERFCAGGEPTLARSVLDRVCPTWLTGNALRKAAMEILMETNQEAYL